MQRGRTAAYPKIGREFLAEGEKKKKRCIDWSLLKEVEVQHSRLPKVWASYSTAVFATAGALYLHQYQ